MNAPAVFDADHYAKLNASRGEVVLALLADLRGSLELRTAIDVGCGMGYFSGLLQSNGFEVTAVDGRMGNVAEARHRYADIKFHEFNAEDPALASLGSFDLCLCFGLLYHLENPLQAIRNLRALTKSILLIEAVTFPGTEPIMALIDEEVLEDQGLRHFAFYPTEACLIKMFYRAGFCHVYGLIIQPQHPGYHSAAGARRTRTVLAASLKPLQSEMLHRISEPASLIRPWDPESGLETPQAVQRLRRFVGKPLSEKIETIKRVVKKTK